MIRETVIIFAFLAVVQAGYLAGPHVGGQSVSSRRQDDFGNYAFNYQIVDGLGATNGRSEVGDAWGNKRGWYNIGDVDGRARRVEYVADAAGFRAVVKTNEPGTAHSAPAAVVVASPYAGPATHAAAPLVARGTHLAYAGPHGHFAKGFHY